MGHPYRERRGEIASTLSAPHGGTTAEPAKDSEEKAKSEPTTKRKGGKKS